MKTYIGHRTCSKQAFEDFKEKNPTLKCTYKEYKEIVYTYFELVFKFLVDTGDTYKLPYGLGDIFIGKKKSKQVWEHDGKIHVRRPIDWKSSKELGERVYYNNYHTDGYKFKFYWMPHTATFKFPVIWKFDITRKFARGLAQVLKVPNNLNQFLYKEYIKTPS